MPIHSVKKIVHNRPILIKLWQPDLGVRYLKHSAYNITGVPRSRPTCDDGERIVLHGQGVTGRR